MIGMICNQVSLWFLCGLFVCFEKNVLKAGTYLGSTANKDMVVNEHERLFNITLRHKLK
jgi:hypothetical protein